MVQGLEREFQVEQLNQLHEAQVDKHVRAYSTRMYRGCRVAVILPRSRMHVAIPIPVSNLREFRVAAQPITTLNPKP